MTYLIGGILFAVTCGSALATPNVESKPTNTLEKTVEYNGREISLNPISRADLRVNLSLEEYKVGDPFKYAGEIQSTRDSWLTIDNQNQTGLEWRLLKDGELFYAQKFEVDFSIIFKKHGILSFSHVDKKIRIKTANTILKHKGINFHTLPRPPLSFSLANNLAFYEFVEPGTYTSQLSSRYSFEGKEYQTIFESEKFEVKEK